MSTAPILTDALIDRVLQEQRRVLRPPNGMGHAAWPFRAEAALATLTSEGWCHVGWIERRKQTTTRTLRYQVWWQVDTGEVRLEQDSRSAAAHAHTPLRLPAKAAQCASPAQHLAQQDV